MLDKTAILYQLNAIKADLHKFGVTQLGLFGSYSNDTATKNSDIDVLIDFEPTQETFDNLMATCAILEQTFKLNKVDVITKNGLSKYISPYILKQTIYV